MINRSLAEDPTDGPKMNEREAQPLVLAGHDAIRIVPLRVPDDLLKPTTAAGPSAAPKLTYRGGPLLTAVKVFTVYWGMDWSSPPLSDTASKLDAFFNFVLSSDLLDQLAEYSVPGLQIGPGTHVGRAIVTSPAPTSQVTDTAVQHMLQQELSTNSDFPTADRNTLLFVYLPPGTDVIQGGSRSCQAFCGYHSDISGQLFYAVMPYPSCAGCTGDLALFDALTSTSSHELCEAITDPIPGQGWYDDVNGEIGDICAWKTRSLGQYVVQQQWSNQANTCV